MAHAVAHIVGVIVCDDHQLERGAGRQRVEQDRGAFGLQRGQSDVEFVDGLGDRTRPKLGVAVTH